MTIHARQRRARWLLAAVVGVAVAAGPPAAAQPAGADAIVGLWATEEDAEDGRAHVEIVRRGDGFEGRIVWLEKPVYDADDERGMGGQPKIDRENPDPALRQRPLLGLTMVQGFEAAGGGRWQGGTIYDPDNGKTYRCKAWLEEDGSLGLRGYIGISLLGRSTRWTRVR